MQELHAAIASILKANIVKFNSLFDAILKKEKEKEREKEKEKEREKEKAKLFGSIVKSNRMVG